MNNNSPKDPSDFPLKQESSDHHHQHEKASSSSAAAAAKASSSSSSSQWLRLKDPRIVRVSRAFGGKDRHSKVCTIRGLRDRRVRLSVPTAIQLYDLQDRLGLNQPSKVVDWLLNAAKHEIDELPPLPNINNPFTLSGFPSSSSNSMINTNEASTSMFNINRSIHQWQGLAQNYSKWNNKSKSSSTKQASSEDNNQMVTEEDNNNKEEEEGDEEEGANVVSTTNPHPHHHHPSFLGLLNTMPIGNYQFEQHNSSNDVNVAQLGNNNHGFITNQTDLQSINVVPFPSTLSLSTGGNNITQSYFPSHSSEAMDNSNNMDPRQQQQINHHHQYHQMLTSHHLHQNLLTNNLPSFSLAMMSTPILLHHSHDTRESSHQSHHKDHHFPSSK